MASLLTIVTAVLSSGIVAAILSFSFAESKERWLLRRAKIEELYLSTSEWLNAVYFHFLPVVRFYKNELTDTQMWAQINDEAYVRDLGLKQLRLKMNIYMYEPSLIPLYERVEGQRRQMADTMGQFKSIANLEPLKRISVQFNEFQVASETLQTAIIARGAEIGAEKGQTAQAYVTAKSQLLKLSDWTTGRVQRAPSRLQSRTGSAEKQRDSMS